MKAEFSHVRIAGVLGVVPSTISRFDDELHNYSHAAANSLKLKAAMGYNEHRVARAGLTTSDLAAFGIQHLIDTQGLDVSTIDALFFISQTPDHILPATSTILHGRFPFAQDTYCVDINDGCCGFIKGLYEASAFLSSTQARRALVICGDVLSRKVSIHDRNSYPLIGDGVTLTLVERTEAPSPLSLEILFDGRGFDKLIIPAGGARLPCSQATADMQTDEDGNRRTAEQLVMQGRDVFVFTQTVVPEFLEGFLQRRALQPQDVDVFLFHQANAFILDRLRAKLDVGKEKVPDRVIRQLGNSSSATIPMAIAAGEPITRTTRAVACGFGVGLSWGAALFELQPLAFQQLIDFKE